MSNTEKIIHSPLFPREMACLSAQTSAYTGMSPSLPGPGAFPANRTAPDGFWGALDSFPHSCQSR